MIMTMGTKLAWLAAAIGLGSMPSIAHAQSSCDRSCLSNGINDVFASLARHDPSSLNLAPAVHYTENGATAVLGQGIWRRAGPATLHLIALDTVREEAAALAVLNDGGRRAIIFVRLTMPDRKIANIETVIVRPGEGQMSRPDAWANGLSPLSGTLPASERSSRSAVRLAMNAYLDALNTSGTRAFIAPPLWDDAQRVENGIQTTGKSFDGKPPKTLAQQLHDGMMPPGMPAPSLRITDRRDEFVDEDLGLGVTIGLMNLDLPAGMPDMPGLHAVSKQNRKQILIEFFKVRQGKVQDIHALMYDLDDPQHQTTGWDTDHSLPPAFPPPPALPTVTGVRDYGLIVADLDQALYFYRDVLGLDLIHGPSPYVSDASWNQVMGTPGAVHRTARLKIPNELFGLELVEFQGSDGKPTTHSHDDPGTSFLNIGYLDPTPVFERLRSSHASVLSANGLPQRASAKGLNAVWLRDPDGHLVEVMQGGWEIEKKSLVGIGNAVRGHFGITEADAGQALGFYRDALGFDLADGFPPMIPPGQFIPVGPMGALLGVAPTASMTGIQGHCAQVRCEMFEFRNGHAAAFRPGMRDPGANFLSLWVADIDSAAKNVLAHGGTIATPTGQPVELAAPAGGNWVPQGERAPIHATRMKALLIRDPAGFLILLMQPLLASPQG